jgi:hypothetical protein
MVFGREEVRDSLGKLKGKGREVKDTTNLLFPRSNVAFVHGG